MEITDNKIYEIAANFQFEGACKNIVPFGSGRINSTYMVESEHNKYILQRINDLVFTKPYEVMENISNILNYQYKILQSEPDFDPKRDILQLIKTKKDQVMHKEEGFGFWRAYLNVEGTKSYDIVETTDLAYESAKGFGKFQRLLDGFDPNILYETIPDFHSLQLRINQLKEAVSLDKKGRLAEVQKELDFVYKREKWAKWQIDYLKTGKTPLRVCHLDTKINNVLMDENTGKGICVIDLDTVMPGTVLSDFGDMVRTFTSTLPEDDPNIEKVDVKLDIFEAMTRGFLFETKEMLKETEKELLVFGGKLITFMQGVRNLTDYLLGDVYYKISYPLHNLDWAKNQFALVKALEKNEEKLQNIVTKI